MEGRVTGLFSLCNVDVRLDGNSLRCTFEGQVTGLFSRRNVDV